MNQPRQRADAALVERGLAESRTRAQALIMAGLVFSGEAPTSRGNSLPPTQRWKCAGATIRGLAVAV